MSEGTVYVEDVASLLTDWDSVRVYRSSGDNPATSIYTALVDTITLVDGQSQYEFSDPLATVNYTWRPTYYNTATTAESSLGSLIRADGNTLRLIRLEAARQAGAGFDGTCSAAGTATTLIDALLRDTGVDEAFVEGSWIYRPDAFAAADRVRRVKTDGYDPDTGTISFDRTYATAPASGEVYHLFNLFPPIDQPGVAYSWSRAVRDGLAVCWFIDQVDLGPGLSPATNRFSLAAFPDITERTWRQVRLRRTDDNGVTRDVSAHTNGRYVTPVSNAGAFSLDIHPAPATTQNVIVEAVRTDAAVYADGDTTATPLRLAVAAAVMMAYRRLRMLQPGKYEGEYAVALSDWQEEQGKQNPSNMIVGL